MSETPNDRPTCKECGCFTGGADYCYLHAPYTVRPLKDGTFMVDKGGSRLRVSYEPPLDDERMAFIALGSQRDWQPIESAPKMQTILLHAKTDDGNWKTATGFYHDGFEGDPVKTPWNWEGNQLRSYDVQPTHWMPLPLPPAEAVQA